jgi:hypothetical protein
MTKITPDHLARSAFVYVRQSTAMQVVHNLESQRRQYVSLLKTSSGTNHAIIPLNAGDDRTAVALAGVAREVTTPARS